VAADQSQGDPNNTIYFGGHSDGITHRLAVTPRPTGRNLLVAVTPLDHHGMPVPDADLILEGSPGTSGRPSD